MMTRSELLPEVFYDEAKVTNELERFQNQFLRPILKFQHAHLCALTHAFLLQFDPNFNQLPAQKRKQQIETIFKKAQSFRQQVIGLIIAFLETEQLDFYLANHTELNKRIWQMAEKRVKDGMF
ncbi:MAG: hypothetical protein ACOVO3_04685 [Fluviicola sp.]